MTGGTIDTEERSRFDPLQRTRDYRFLTRQQRLGFTIRQRIQSLALQGGPGLNTGGGGGKGGFGGGGGGGKSAVGIVTKLPDAQQSTVSQFFLKRNQGADDTLNIGLLDADDTPIIVPLNTQIPTDLSPVVQAPPIANSGLSQLIAPVDVDVDGSGNIYVADPGSQAIKEYSPNGQYVRQLTPPLGVAHSLTGSLGAGTNQYNQPRGIARHPTNGNFYVADQLNNRLQILDSTINNTGNVALGVAPIDIAFDATGNAYYIVGTSIRCTNPSFVLQQTISVAGPGSCLFLCVMDAATYGLDATYIFASDQTANKVRCYKSTTAPTGFVETGFSPFNGGIVGLIPNGICCDAAGRRLYLANSSTSHLHLFTLTMSGTAITGATLTKTVGAFSATQADGMLNTPFGLTRHPKTGNIFVGDTGLDCYEEWTSELGYIRRFGTNGTTLGRFTTPYSLAFAADGSYAVMVDFDARIQKAWTDATAFDPVAISHDVTIPFARALDGTLNHEVCFVPPNGFMSFRQALNPLYSSYGQGSIEGLYQVPSYLQNDGLAASSWSDSSVNNRSATQATGANQPIFRMTGSRTLGGWGGLEFDGTNDYLTCNVSASDIDMALIAVVTVDNTAAAKVLLGASANGGIEIFWDPATQNITVNKQAVAGIGSTPNNSFIPGFPHVLVVNLTATTWEISIDGVLYSGAHAVSLTGGLTAAIGAGIFTGTPGAFWDGMVYSVGIWTDHWTTAQRQMQEGLYAWQFGIQAQLPGGHPYQLVSPTVSAQVADIDGTQSIFSIVDRGNKLVWAHTTRTTCDGAIGTTTVGGVTDPVAIASNNADNSFYLLDQGSQSVKHNAGYGSFAALDAGFGEYGNSDGQFLTPQGVAVDKDGRIWVSDSGRNDVQVFDAAYKFLGKVKGGVGATLDGLAFHPTVNVGYVADPANGKISLIRVPDQPIFFFPTAPVLGDQLTYDGQVLSNYPGGRGKWGQLRTIDDDFGAGIYVANGTNVGELAWTNAGLNNNIQQLGTADRPGIARLFQTAGINNYSQLYLGSANWLAWNNVSVMEWLFSIDTSNVQNIVIGMTDNLTTFANAYFLQFNGAGNFTLNRNLATVNQSVSLGVAPVLGAIYQLLMSQTASGECTAVLNRLDAAGTGTAVVTGGPTTTVMVPQARAFCLTAVTVGLNLDYWRLTMNAPDRV